MGLMSSFIPKGLGIYITMRGEIDRSSVRSDLTHVKVRLMIIMSHLSEILHSSIFFSIQSNGISVVIFPVSRNKMFSFINVFIINFMA